MTARFIVGDTREVTAGISDGSVDLILTSPPFLALRSYLPADHPDKSKEIGSEANPAAFIDVLLSLTAEWRRILAPHGSLVVELGDTYSGSGGAGGDYNADGLREGQQKFKQRTGWHRDGHGDKTIHRVGGVDSGTPNFGTGWPLAKSLALVPELYRVALAYGLNPLTGQPSPAGRWRVRNVVRWVRPNPPVGALGDKFRPATSDLVVACVAGDRWFDLDAVRTPYLHPDHPQVGKPTSYRPGMSGEGYGDEGQGVGRIRTEHPAGAPPLDWWQIANTKSYVDLKSIRQALVAAKSGRIPDLCLLEENAPSWLRACCDEIERLTDASNGAPLDWWQIVPGGYSGAHYAVWPPALCERPIEAMCPRRVCVTCGKPSRRITTVEYEAHSPHTIDKQHQMARGKAASGTTVLGVDASFVHGRADKNVTTVGWSSCGCPNSDGLQLDGYHTGSGWRPGLVFDPFVGSGTTLVVAHGHSRDSIGADLDPRNAELAKERLGMFLDVETTERVA